MSIPKIIAFYLPQYHPTPDNDKWWGKGFTEWTNVGKAKPLFRGHYQPKVPADLGYYDLRLPEVREAQAKLAKEAGIYGFCYYHYWFGNGKEELEQPFNEVIRIGEPDIPFMICWANESWHKKFWDKDGKGSSREILIEQTYPGEQDIIDHFNRLLPAFKDSRYIHIDGKPVFMVYKPDEIPDLHKFIKTWNKLAISAGINGIYFIGHLQSIDSIQVERSQIERLLNTGLNGVNIVRLLRPLAVINKFIKTINLIRRIFFSIPRTIKYKTAIKYLSNENDKMDSVFPTLVPNWDHTPRSGVGGLVYTESTPDVFDQHLLNVINLTQDKQQESNLVFLKSWNEWGEGNYIEPDLKFGHGFLNVLKSRLLNK